MTDVIALSESWRAWGLKSQGDVVTASVQRSQGKVKFYCTEAWNGHVVVIPELGADSPSRPGAAWRPVAPRRRPQRDARGVIASPPSSQNDSHTVTRRTPGSGQRDCAWLARRPAWNFRCSGPEDFREGRSLPSSSAGASGLWTTTGLGRGRGLT